MKNSETFISVEDALELVLNASESFGTESVDFDKSLGAMLAIAVGVAPSDSPVKPDEITAAS